MPSKSEKHNWYPPWAPRFWNGMCFGSFFSLLKENRFEIDISRYPMAFLVGCCATLNSTCKILQQITHGKRIDAAELNRPPVFVIGHWRSGTTLMHELLALDERFAFPSNFDAFIPNHFLFSRSFLYPLASLLMPPSRPMDNMAMGIASPQEDDFALCAMGAPTPYRRIAFPNRKHRDHLLLNMDNASPEELQDLKNAMTSFLKALTVRYGKQLILKSPPHTGRIQKLAEWFPGARFIHLSRNPYELVPSTIRLWKTLDQLMGFQLPRYDDAFLKNHIFECQDLMYAAYHQQRSSIPSSNLIEIRYEDLIADPLSSMKQVYEQLSLGDFKTVAPAISGYFDSKKSHQRNQLSIDEGLRIEIDSHWAIYKQLFGYQTNDGSPAKSV